MKAGVRVKLLRGQHEGKIGTVVKANGTAPYVVIHNDDEVVLRGPGDLSRGAKLYIVPASAVRETEPVFPYVGYLMEV